MPHLTELHTHLYGCLDIDDLDWLAGRKEPRWHIFRISYLRTHAREPEIDKLFLAGSRSRKLLQGYYHFLRPDRFAAFQACFDLVIALSHTDAEELHEVAQRIVSRESHLEHAEYRMMFSPLLSLNEFSEKVCALSEGFEKAEKNNPHSRPRLAMSLSRDNAVGVAQYETLRSLQRTHEATARHLVALDFCAAEEGFPPKRKRDFFRRIRSENRESPRPLAILYHVGESYRDKSVESAARWVVESAQMGVHRLGHAVALGVNPAMYAGQSRTESVEERLDQIDFEFLHKDSLSEHGCPVDTEALTKEKKSLQKKDLSETITVVYDDERIRRLESFQDWAMEKVRRTGAVVESCPTSNLRIAELHSEENHPLRRFLDAGLSVAIGADDPGILDTDLLREFEIIRSWKGIDENRIKSLQATARNSTSESLTKRSKETT